MVADPEVVHHVDRGRIAVGLRAEAHGELPPEGGTLTSLPVSRLSLGFSRLSGANEEIPCLFFPLLARVLRMSTVRICETFTSIQGESTYAGLLCFFIRLAECNLRCSYCDTQHAYGPGTPEQIDALVEEATRSGAAIIEITGGEPLMQPAFAELATSLRDLSGRPILVETNGSCDISVVPEGVVAVLDIKCPGSSESARMDLENLERLRPHDEVKFVITDRADYEWSKDLVLHHDLARKCSAVLFGHVHGRQDASELARWIMHDELPVRLQVQLHKLLGLK